MNFITVLCHWLISCVTHTCHETAYTLLASLYDLVYKLSSIVLAAHFGFLGTSSDWKVLKIVSMLHVTQALLLCLVYCSYSYSHEESVTVD